MVFESVGQLVVLRCWCGIQHAVPESLRKEQMREFNNGRQPMDIYCPLGHSHIPGGESEAEKLNKQLAAERARHDQTRAELKAKENALNAQKAAKSRIKNRIANGVCPCCKRSFANLHRHMKDQHPEFAASND